MKNIKYLFTLILISLSSCAVLDYPKKIAGYSITNFQDEQKGKFIITSQLPAQKAYNKCNLFLFENRVKTNFKNDKKMYVVASNFSVLFDHCLDSTEVGFFIYPQDNEFSKVEVISNNSNLSKFVYNKLSEYIKK